MERTENVLYAKVFVADASFTTPGTNYMAKGFALVAINYVVPEVGQRQALYAAPVSGPFQVADYLLIRSLDSDSVPHGVNNAWFKLVEIREENTVVSAVWLVEHVHGGKVGRMIGKGHTIANFGQATEPAF